MTMAYGKVSGVEPSWIYFCSEHGLASQNTAKSLGRFHLNSGVLCLIRRGKVTEVDGKAGVAHVELPRSSQAQTELPPPPDATAEGGETPAAAPISTSTSTSTTSDGGRVFFLLKARVV